MGDEPSPDFAAAVNEQFSLLLDSLDDPSLLAVLKLEGYTNEEIARAIDCTVTTVERKLNRIRKKWQRKSGQVEAES
ncbi:MAG: hypothetical protein HUU20_27255 [Pirellulales bacterium]|nr:hypothetical protein [Pirellulales bacterium]